MDDSDVFKGLVIDEDMVRRYIEQVKRQFPGYADSPQLLHITTLAVACERLLDERSLGAKDE